VGQREYLFVGKVKCSFVDSMIAVLIGSIEKTETTYNSVLRSATALLHLCATKAKSVTKMHLIL